MKNYEYKLMMKRFLEKSYLLCVIGLSILLVLSFFSGTDIRGVESNVIYTIQRILSDNTFLYQNPNELPYAITQYTPLYYLLCDLVASVAGINAFDVLGIRQVSKLISFTFLLTSSYYFYAILCYHIKLNKHNAFLFTSLFVVVTFPWFTITRPDVLVSAFMIMSVYFYFNYRLNVNPFYIYLIGFLCFLSFASKQTGLLFGFVFCVYMLYRRQWNAIVRFSIGFCVGLVCLGVVLYIAEYDITFLKANIVDGVSDFSLMYAIKSPYRDFVIYYSLLFLGVIIFIKRNLRSIVLKQNSQLFFLILTSVLLFLFSAGFALKSGSGLNYFNDFIIVLLLVIACLVKQYNLLEPMYKNKYHVFILIIGIQICIVHYIYYAPKISRGVYEEHLSNSTLRDEINTFLKESVDASYFYSEDRRINMNNFEQCVLPQYEIYQSALHKNVFDFTNLSKDFRNGNIKYLILYSNLNSILGIDVQEYYVLEKDIGPMHIYKHKFY